MSKIKLRLEELKDKIQYAKEENDLYTFPVYTGQLIGFNEGVKLAREEILEILDGRTVECMSRFGKWWMNLEQLKERIEKLGESITERSVKD